MLRIQLLGEFRVWMGERPIPPDQWKLRKAQNLLKLLALAPQHRLHKEELMEQLWPESDPKSAANSLHRVLYVARRALEPTGAPGQNDLQFQEEWLYLRPELPLWIDVEAFETAAVQAHSSKDISEYRAALALYAGELLPEDRYEDWASPRREALRLEYLNLLLELGRLHETRSEYALAIEALKRLLSTDPAYEGAHAGLMRLYALSGQRQQAIRQYQALQQALRRELDAEPEPQTTRLHQEILSGRFPPPDSSVETQPVSASELSAAREPDPLRHNLPAQLTSFVGRERGLAELRQLLIPPRVEREGQPTPLPGGKSRLVTLTGVGGCGKTRMALECAYELVDAFPAGVWLVELAGLSDPELVPQAVASVLGVRELPGKPLLESLAAYLKSRQLLLLLDNCEHLVEACARLVEALLQACPALRILATSREALGLPGERLYPVTPLSVPGTQQHLSLEELAGYEAVRLFVERARAVLPDFQLTPANATAVAQICARLDGLPLAIELAAVRTDLLSAEQIAARLDDRFRLLTRGSRTAPRRQQTLQAALDWSYHLLSEYEQALFRRLSVFAGGFDLEAVEAVGAPALEGENAPPVTVLDLLSRLVDHSLVAVEWGEGRCRLLETVRAYTLEQLEANGDAEIVLRRHAEYFLALAEQAEPELKTERQLEWLERLEREHDNLRAALAWCLSQGETETGQRLAGALWYFWFLHGHIGEGLRWLNDALVASDGAEATRFKAIAGAVFLTGRIQINLDETENLCEEGLGLARSMGDRRFVSFFIIQLGFSRFIRRVDDARVAAWYLEGLEAARETKDSWLIAFSLAHIAHLKRSLREYVQATLMAEEGLSFARETGDRWLIARLLYRLGYAVSILEDFPRARACHNESLTLWQALGDRLSMTYALLGLGFLAFRQGDYVSAYHYQEERFARSAEVDHRIGMIHALNALGVVAHRMGDDQQAQARFEEGFYLSQESDYPWGGAVQLNSLGFLALSQGNVEKAQEYFLGSLKLYQEMNDQYLLAGNLYGLVKIALLQGQLERAARWLGAVGTSFDYRENTMNPGFDIWIETDVYIRDIADVHAQLSEASFAAAWEAGRAMGLDGAIQEALALVAEIQLKTSQN
jgi:predicted ATPase/DNA-binding SARP family transcriptional activator